MKDKRLTKKSGQPGFAKAWLIGLLGLAVGGAALFGFSSKYSSGMEQLRVSVYDTYVHKRQGGVMHFDILVASTEKDLQRIYGYGKDYLKTKGQEGQPLTAKECRFCHFESAKGPVEDSIKAKGYYIIEMEGCN